MKFNIFQWNQRHWLLFFVVLGSSFLVALTIFGMCLPEESYAINYGNKYAAPSWQYLFGTDHLGRDMFYRSLKGISLSVRVGLLTAFFGSFIAVILGALSATFGGKVDSFVLWLIDVFMAVPHILLIIMISVSLGGGEMGVIIGIAVTHWCTLARVIRGEVMQLRQEVYVQAARSYGHSYMKIAFKHFLPHIAPQYVIGLVLMFPHAILHEAGITFLGYGLPLETPAIGVILSESIRHISLGMWWLAFFPGLILVMVAVLFDRLGTALRTLINPMTAQK